MKSNYKLDKRDTNFVFGSINPTGDWSSHLFFNEVQLVLDGEDSDDCVPFSVQEAIDMQIDLFISNGTIPISIVNQLSTMGFMDTGTDGQKHFHSSPRFLGIMTGNKQNGNSTQEVGDVLRKYGALPYTDLPPNVDTAAEYYAPCTAAQLAKASQFLSILGGKNAIQYHAISQGTAKDMVKIAVALELAPVQVGVAVASDWNQIIPAPDPAENAAPEHCMTCYKTDGISLFCLDHYLPFDKQLDKGYPANYISQVVVQPIIQEEQAIIADTASVVADVAAAPIPPAQKETLLQEAVEVIKEIAEIIS